MTLRIITIDNSVSQIISTNTSKCEHSHDHKPKTVSNPRKQKKHFTKQGKNH